MQRVNRPFVGIPSFLRARICEDLTTLDAAIAVFGVPFDEGSPFFPGSRMAPRSLREHSLRFARATAAITIRARARNISSRKCARG